MRYIAPSKQRRLARKMAQAQAAQVAAQAATTKAAIDAALQRAADAEARAAKATILNETLVGITDTISGIKTPNGTLRKIDRMAKSVLAA